MDFSKNMVFFGILGFTIIRYFINTIIKYYLKVESVEYWLKESNDNIDIEIELFINELSR